MSQKTITKLDQDYDIRKHKNVFRYRVTVPNTLFESAGIEQGTDLGAKAIVRDNRLGICYTTDTSQANLTVSASKHTSGELSIPSSIGASARLDEHSITWELEETEHGYNLIGLTTNYLPEYTEENSIFVEVNTLKHVEQDINQENSEWSQEHFQLYLDVTAVDQIDWEAEITVAIELVQIDGEVSVLFNPDTSESNEKSTKTITDTGEYQRDLLAYIPNDMVRTLNLIDTQLSLRRSKDKTKLLVTEL